MHWRTNLHDALSAHNYVDIFRMMQPNGLRYPLVGGTRQRHFDGTNLEPRKLLENAQTPTSRVHAVLGSVDPVEIICC